MIYETAFVVKQGTPEANLKKIQEQVTKTIADANGEVLVNDDWGLRTFAQPTRKGLTHGQYLYLIYKTDSNVNAELERRYKLSEDVIKFIVVKLGEDDNQEEILKNYNNPNNETMDKEALKKAEKEKKILSKRKSCWFTTNKTQPDWKNPKTYRWLVNEFGKISPARVTGLRPRFQRSATTAIKRGRVMGMISHLSNRTSERA